MDKTTLRECPFCGYRAETYDIHAGPKPWYICCGNPDCGHESSTGRVTRNEAIAAWNTRPIEDKLKRDNEALLEALKIAVPSMPHVEYGNGRCEVCGWPLADSAKSGCVVGDCSFRPSEHTDDYWRIRRQRQWLQAHAAIKQVEEASNDY